MELISFRIILTSIGKISIFYREKKDTEGISGYEHTDIWYEEMQ